MFISPVLFTVLEVAFGLFCCCGFGLFYYLWFVVGLACCFGCLICLCCCCLRLFCFCVCFAFASLFCLFTWFDAVVLIRVCYVYGLLSG